DLDLARGRGKAAVAVFAIGGLERHADATRRGAQCLQIEAARLQVMIERRRDVAVPEMIADPETDGEVEHDVDIGPRLAARRDHGRAKLHQFAGIPVEAEPDPQPLALPGAGDW